MKQNRESLAERMRRAKEASKFEEDRRRRAESNSSDDSVRQRQISHPKRRDNGER